MKFINIRPDETIEVTDMLYLNLASKNLIDKQDIPLPEIESKNKFDPDFKISNYHRFVIRELEKSPEGLSAANIYDKFKNDLTVQDPLRKANSFITSCEKLLNNGYIVKLDDKYFVHSKTRFLLDGELKFTYADVRIFRDLQKDALSMNVEKLKERFQGDEEKIKMLLGRVNKLEYSGYISKINNGYTITELGKTKLTEFKSNLSNNYIIKEFEFSKYDANIVFKYFNEQNTLSLKNLQKQLLEKYTDPTQAEKQFEILSKRINKLVEKEFVAFDAENDLFHITFKGFEKAKEVRSEFKFTSYDSNVIFGYINKANGSLSIEQLQSFLKDEYKLASERIGQLDYLKNRIENNLKAGYVGFDDAKQAFYITEKGLEASEVIQIEFQARQRFVNADEQIKTSSSNKKSAADVDISDFKLTTFDKEILNKQSINLEERLEYLQNRYGDNTKEIKRQIRMWEVRCQKLELTGYLELKDDIYRITGKGLEFLNAGSKDVSPKDFILGKYDVNYIFKQFNADKLSLADLDNNLKKRYKNTSEYTKQYNMITGRLKKLESNGLIVFNKDLNLYELTQKGFDEISKFKFDNLQHLDEVRDLARNFKLSDDTKKHISKFHSSRKFPEKTYFIDGFNYIDEIKNTLNDVNSRIERTCDSKTNGYSFYKTYKEPIGKTFNGDDLNTLKVVIKDNGFVWSAYPLSAKEFTNDIFYVSKFDYSNIYEATKNKIWSKESLREKYNDLSEVMFHNKMLSVEKRLQNLEELNAVKYIGNGKYELSDFYIERSLLSREKGLDRLTTEQKQILFDLKDFYNLTSSQIEKYIYKEFQSYAKAEANKLVSNGYVNVTSRDLYGDGKFTDIYYLTPKGKKAISHLSGHEVEKIFDSKLHHRPEELKHDLYVYTAYKDMEKNLLENDIKIDKHFTDKDLRSLDMKTKGRQRIEYPDLTIEFTDIRTGEKGYINVEVDCGYKPSVIKSKAENIDNLVWYTDSNSQAERIINVSKDAKVIVISL